MFQSDPRRFASTMNDQGIFCGRVIGDMLIHCVVSFDNGIDENRMKKAVRLSLDAEPILGCRCVTGWWRMYWERRTDLDNIGLFRFAAAEDTEKEVIRFLTAPADPCEDPQIQLLLIRSERDTLCIKVNHVAADAGAVKAYAYLLASVYQKLGDNPGYTPEINLSGTRSMRQISSRFGFSDKFRMLRRGLRDLKNIFLPRMNYSFSLTKGSVSDRTFLLRRIQSEQFRRLRDYGRQHGATINDLLLTAIYRAFFELIRPEPGIPLRLVTTADLRRYLPTKKAGAVCNLSGLVYLNMTRKSGSAFNDTLSEIRDRMNFIKKDFIGLGQPPLFVIPSKILPAAWNQWLGNRMFRQSLSIGKNITHAFTNMGIIDTEQLVFGSVKVSDAFLTAPVVFSPFFLIGLSGFGESLTMSAGFCDTAVNKPVVEHLLSLIENELQQIR
ncbi:phthiocerol/phthiodiolone dimycocerosyl transferase family protein [Desulfonema magnum]|uniref:Phthiocerol/phthiodiolone dimycocerosyl transferase n=1 Tax=Desulfonema magnum TaxID=45655 RepID=A0A975BV07_9BACT|nr:hypothetical protein [Desulfonema magnum]QTA92254.1 Uncharacterized protein dnm_083300 [Desulfonema magnum]